MHDAHTFLIEFHNMKCVGLIDTLLCVVGEGLTGMLHCIIQKGPRLKFHNALSKKFLFLRIIIQLDMTYGDIS